MPASLKSLSLEVLWRIVNATGHPDLFVTCKLLRDVRHQFARVVKAKGKFSLQTLDCSGCSRITNLSPLSNLSCLQTLNCSGCYRITNLSPLSNLSCLQTLNCIGNNGITDLSPLSNLSSLHILMKPNRYCLVRLARLSNYN